jgi:cell division septation protein DedD
MGGAPNVPAAVPAPAPPAAAARPRAPESVGVRPGPAPAPRAGGNAPLAIVPAAQGAAQPVEPPRSRVARTEAPSAPVATAPAAPPSGGGYTVQVTSQRSEAEAQTAFKSLQAKFPAQLGNRQPIIHRADLGDKGTYYRALVGPFASSEAAASMCSNLKAAGGSCLVQKN